MVFEELFFCFFFLFRLYMYSAKSSGVLSDGWMVFCIEMFYTHLSLSLSVWVRFWQGVCVVYRIDCAMSCHVIYVDVHLPTYLPTY